ncbi:hypothetical protein [Acidocella aminolytica]|nr:hypothetical protein [Acidocella aminolytica]
MEAPQAGHWLAALVARTVATIVAPVVSMPSIANPSGTSEA